MKQTLSLTAKNMQLIQEKHNVAWIHPVTIANNNSSKKYSLYQKRKGIYPFLYAWLTTLQFFLIIDITSLFINDYQTSKDVTHILLNGSYDEIVNGIDYINSYNVMYKNTVEQYSINSTWLCHTQLKISHVNEMKLIT